MGSILLFGFFIGMKHALEADHVAAVASLATRSRSVPATVRMSAIWGLGHALTLLVFGTAVLLFDTMVRDDVARVFELAVGGMLVVLGADVLRRLIVERIHWHVHAHDGRARLRLRALLVGTMHGLAGSAALVLLALGTMRSVAQGFATIAMFGI